MLRETVNRESTTDSVQIDDVVISKFAGTVQRGAYAARVIEPPSLRRHRRLFHGVRPRALPTCHGPGRVVLAAWREERVDKVGDGARAALLNAALPCPPAGDAKAPSLGKPWASFACVAERGSPTAESARAIIEMLTNVLALADNLIRAKRATVI